MKHFYTFLNSFWKYISFSGISQGYDKEHDITVLINRASFLTAVATILYAAGAWYILNDEVYSLISCTIGALYGMVILLHHFKLFAFVRIYFSVIVPMWIYTVHLCIGGQFSQSAALITTLVLIYVFFEKTPRQLWIYSGINVGLFILVTGYVEIFGTIIPQIDRPFDEIGVFIVSLIWIYLVLKKHDLDQQSLIANLEQKNIKLKNTTEELERFTNIASHDLKSPIRNIVSFLGLMERDIKRGNHESLSSHLEFAKSGALQMNYLVQGILDISRVDSNAHEERNWVDLNQIIERVKVNLAQDLAESNALLVCEELPTYCCNDVEFTLLFQNLIQNGLKYNTSTPPKIKVWSESLPDKSCKIHFSDNGIGIAPKYHQYVFEHFKRLHSSQNFKGTGLGLSICKKIVQKHQGDILLDSVVGSGSIFTIHLPCQDDLADTVKR